MKKIANFIGLGVLATLGFGLIFWTISCFISLGNVFDAFDVDGGYGFVLLLCWIITIAAIGLLIAFIVVQLIKAIPNIKNLEDEKSLFRMNIISGLLAAQAAINGLIIIIYFAGNGADVGGRAIAVLILAILALGAALVSFLLKNLPTLVRVILTLSATLIMAILVIMSIGGDGLMTVYYVFAMLALFGGLAYVVLENLDAFKGNK